MPKQEPREQVHQIPLSEIHPFRNHPFKVLDDELMQQTISNICLMFSCMALPKKRKLWLPSKEKR